MFNVNDIRYVKTSFGYEKCTILKKKGSYYIIKTETSTFGATEHRLISAEDYDKRNPVQQKPTYYKPPDLH